MLDNSTLYILFGTEKPLNTYYFHSPRTFLFMPEVLVLNFNSFHIIGIMKPGRTKWVGHVLHTGEMRNACNPSESVGEE
jgi:hypothetical protein